MSSKTQMALAAILNEEYFTPEESLEYLQSGDHFMTFSEELTRRLGKPGNESSSEETYKAIVKILHKNNLAPSRDTYIRKWLFGDSVPDREYAVKLCFALGLNELESVEFLRKACKYNGFNFRDAKEIIYYYCLKYGKTYEHALGIIARYDSAPCDEENTPSDEKSTRVIRDVFTSMLMEDEEAFVGSLCDNKANFFGYSLTAYKKYLELKRRLIVKIVLSHLNSAYLHDFQDDVYIALIHLLSGLAKGDSDFISELRGFKAAGPKQDMKLLWNSLTKKIDSKCEQRPLKWVHEKNVNGRVSKTAEETLTQDQFFQKLVPNDMLLQLIYLDIPFVKKTAVNKKSQKETVYNDFLALQDETLKKALEGTTYAQYFSEMDNNPKKIKRAVLVLLFFADYFCDFDPDIDPPDNMDTYENFYVGLDKMLDECGMARIYQANQLDWLILKSVKAVENKDDPMLFFNEVLKASYPADIGE
jgi:hypothetical protein